MKLSRNMIAILAAFAMLAVMGCGKTTNSTGVTSLDTTPPPAPENLVLQSGVSNDLNWDASSAADVARYQVFKYSPDPSREDSYILIGETSATQYTLPAVTAPTESYFKVRAVDASGNTSSMSTPYDITLAPTTSGGNGNGGGRRTIE